MRIFRYAIWLAGIAVLAVTVPVVRGLPVTSYGGVAPWRLWLEAGAALALLVVSAAEPCRSRRVAAGVAGATWLVPELAGWVAGPAWLATVADAWSRMLPAVVLAAVLAGEPRHGRRSVGALAMSGSALAAGSRLVLVDPFLDVRCWRRCDHNPLLLAHTTLGTTLEHLGGLVIAGCAVIGGVLALVDRRRARWPAPVGIAAMALIVGSVDPGVLRLVVAESATSAAYLALFVAAQSGAIALVAALIRARAPQWRLRMRLVRLSSSLSSGSVATALRLAVPDPELQVRYWAAGRAGFVDAEGRPVDPLESDPTHRVTLVKRREQPVAALVHARDVDGAQLNRVLGASLRLVLENEQLRAATLAELHELTRSRARIVERAALERRRLERNLHDGAQQRVVSLSLLVRMAAHRIEQEDAALALARRAEALTDATVQELRRVAHGIYPAVLSDAGLSGAVLDLAESSVDVAVCVDGIPSSRYSGTVETTAYLAVAAAIADARSRGASVLSVDGREHAGALVLDLQDDAGVATSHAVLDLADQVGALAGVLAVEPRCGGTRVHLELPCGS